MMVQDAEVGLKRSSTITFIMLDKVLMVMGEVDIFIRPALLHPVIKIILVDNWVFIVIVMAEVYIGLRPSNFLRITMVDYTLHTQYFPKNILQGVWKEKIHIKMILIIIIQVFHHTLIKAYNKILITTCNLIAIQSFHHT